MRWKSSIREVMVAVALAGLTGAVFAGGALAEPASVGQVVALSGAVQAAVPGQEPRTLSCNDSVYEGEVLSTSEGARVGILSSEIYAQLDTGSRLSVASRDGVPSFRLTTGAARLVDTRSDSGARAFEIATPHASASGLGSDIEIWLVSSAGESQSRICSRGAPLRVSGAESPLGEEGECAVATAEGVSSAGAAPEPSIALAGTTACATELAGVAARFTPTDVAAPPFGMLAFPDVLAGPASPRDPCDDPAAACSGVFPRPVPTPRRPDPRPRGRPKFVDPDPDTPCAPGAICNGGDSLPTQ